MLQDIVTKGSTDRSVRVKIIDSTDGTPETGVVFNTAGIDLWYRRELAARVAITEATLAALTTAHTDGGFLHISDGVYRLDLPDAAFATGANYVEFGGTVTGMVVIGGVVRLVDVNLEVANIPANVVQISGDSTAADNLETAFDDTAGPVPHMGIVDQGTAQSASATGVVLRSAAAFADDTLIGAIIGVHGSTQGYWQFREITDNALSGDTVTVDTWTVTPSGTITYKIFGGPAISATYLPNVNVTQISGDAGAADNAEAFFDGTGYAGTNNVIPTVTTVNGLGANVITAAATAADFTTEIQSGLATATALADVQTDTNDIQSRLPAALVSGRIDASVGAMAANVMTAAAAAADLTTEIQSGLATAAALSTVDGKIDAIDNFVDTEVAAIKAVTDKLDTTIELTSDATYIFTVDALANGPSGSGSSPSAIADEVQTRTIAAVTMVNGLAANSVNASALAADAVTEIQSGLATAAALGTVDTVVDAIKVTTDKLDGMVENTSDGWIWTLAALQNAPSGSGLDAAGVRAAIGMASANLDTQLGDIPTAAENADALLDRNMATGADNGSTTVRTPRQALRILRNRWSIDSDGLQTITKEDDSTPSWTQQLASDASAAPVTGTDPAGP
jgi:hypothetical protein